MTAEQTSQFHLLNELVVVLQNKCNRAQSSLVKAESETDSEAIDRLLGEAANELIEDE